MVVFLFIRVIHSVKIFRLSGTLRATHYSFGLLCVSLMLAPATAAEVAGVNVSFVDYSGPATLSIKATDKYELRINIEPQAERKALTLKVDLPKTGRNVWPFIDVEVLDSKGQAVTVRRGGIEWHKLLITVPAKRSAFVVHAVEPAGDRPQFRSEKDRHAIDPRTGLSATISKWYDGRRTALSIRFDDSHPTHLSKAIPVLNEYGFRGTFMVNPGGHPPNSRRRSAFEDHRAEWKAVAKSGDHEFANHTLHHRGAQNDEEMDRQIGEAAKAIRKLFPNKSKLLALNLGGGTQWTTTKTLRFYLDKHHLFVNSGSTGMDDVYGNRVATFQRLLENHIERGLWYRVHYHYIGEGLSTSDANFRAALDIAKEHQHMLWIAGMADIHKYQTERRGAKLEIENKTEQRIILKLSCTTKPALYDQPLTIDVTLPKSWATERVRITDHVARKLDVRKVSASDGVILRFDVRPTDAEYTIEKTLHTR
jgi:peptidoglycan/xylan/chitin deacetylase (PgdA/CDA1 family)